MVIEYVGEVLREGVGEVVVLFYRVLVCKTCCVVCRVLVCKTCCVVCRVLVCKNIVFFVVCLYAKHNSTRMTWLSSTCAKCLDKGWVNLLLFFVVCLCVKREDVCMATF
jgi:hypothetical protein